MKEHIVFRVATETDADAVAGIYDHARLGFRKSGIPQWQEGRPNRESFLEDVGSGTARVLLVDGEVAATCQLVTYEPTYDRIVDGAWQTGSYIAVHRVAVAEAFRRRGLAGRMLREAEAYARMLGRQAVRIDTHEKNGNMRAMLEKNGYERRGTIYLADGAPRFAFEKRLSDER